MNSFQQSFNEIIKANVRIHQVVKFSGVTEKYPAGKSIVCVYKFPVEFSVESGDWIGIYPLNWSDLNIDAIKRKPVHFTSSFPTSEYNYWSNASSQLKYDQVEFDLTDLEAQSSPSFASRLYQFVYVRPNEITGPQVYGTSTPFSFVSDYYQQTGPFVSMPPKFDYEQQLEEINSSIAAVFKTFNSVPKRLSELTNVSATGALVPQQIERSLPFSSYEELKTRSEWKSRIEMAEKNVYNLIRISQLSDYVEKLEALENLSLFHSFIGSTLKREQQIRAYNLTESASSFKTMTEAEIKAKFYQLMNMRQQIERLIQFVHKLQAKSRQFYAEYESTLNKELEEFKYKHLIVLNDSDDFKFDIDFDSRIKESLKTVLITSLTKLYSELNYYATIGTKLSQIIEEIYTKVIQWQQYWPMHQFYPEFKSFQSFPVHLMMQPQHYRLKMAEQKLNESKYIQIMKQTEFKPIQFKMEQFLMPLMKLIELVKQQYNKKHLIAENGFYYQSLFKHGDILQNIYNENKSVEVLDELKYKWLLLTLENFYQEMENLNQLKSFNTPENYNLHYLQQLLRFKLYNLKKYRLNKHMYGSEWIEAFVPIFFEAPTNYSFANYSKLYQIEKWIVELKYSLLQMHQMTFLQSKLNNIFQGKSISKDGFALVGKLYEYSSFLSGLLNKINSEQSTNKWWSYQKGKTLAEIKMHQLYAHHYVMQKFNLALINLENCLHFNSSGQFRGDYFQTCEKEFLRFVYYFVLSQLDVFSGSETTYKSNGLQWNVFEIVEEGSLNATYVYEKLVEKMGQFEKYLNSYGQSVFGYDDYIQLVDKLNFVRDQVENVMRKWLKREEPLNWKIEPNYEGNILGETGKTYAPFEGLFNPIENETRREEYYWPNLKKEMDNLFVSMRTLNGNFVNEPIVSTYSKY